MIKFHDVTKINIKEHNPNWRQIPDHPYTILIIEAQDLEKQIHQLIKKLTNQILVKFIYILNIDIKQKIYC